MRFINLWALFVLCSPVVFISAQQVCPPGLICQEQQYPTVVTSGPKPEEVNVSNWYTIFTGPNRQPTKAEIELAERIKFSAVRIYQGNGCGTGSLCGRDEQFIYILTNAHVASTRIGSLSRCQAVVDGKLQEFQAEAIETAYSSKYRTDWTLLRASVKFMQGIEPIQLSMEMPDPQGVTVTWGHPQCKPTQGHSCQTVRFGTVWLWNPNAIGGQSGSAVVQLVNGKPVQKGLLTWSEGDGQVRRGSGQFTKTIWEQSSSRTNVGELRTGQELVPTSATDNPLGVELDECYSTAEGLLDVSYQGKKGNPASVTLEDKWAAIGDKKEVSLRRYPIWFENKKEEEEEDSEKEEDDNRRWTVKEEGTAFVLTDGQYTVTVTGDASQFLSNYQGAQNQTWFGADSLKFLLFLLKNRDELQRKAEEIKALIDWIQDFIARAREAGDTLSTDALQLEILLLDLDGQVETGNWIKEFLRYAANNPDVVLKWIEFIRVLL